MSYHLFHARRKRLPEFVEVTKDVRAGRDVIATRDVHAGRDFFQKSHVLLPRYSVIMYSGAPDSIPAGWLLCDGRTVVVDGTAVTSPDLRGRFVLSYGQGPLNFENMTVGATGGEQNHTLTISEIPSHTHSTNSDAPSTGLVTRTGNNTGVEFDNSSGELDLINASSLTINSTGGGEAHNNMPPYYVLCFIMKGF